MISELKVMSCAARSTAKNFLDNYRYLKALELLKKEVNNARQKKIIIGAGGNVYPGWIATDIHNLDVTSEENWTYVFVKNSIDNLLAEHVFEHLTLKQARKAFKLALQFLKPGGVFRLAVPDGLFPSEEYINYVRPGGVGVGADDHKILYTYKTLEHELTEVGYSVNLLEFWNEKGTFVYNSWNTENCGMIKRSKNHDERNKNNDLKYTSLIVDAQKIPY